MTRRLAGVLRVSATSLTAYLAPGNILLLFIDDGDAAGLTNMMLARTASLEHSQCRVNAHGVERGAERWEADGESEYDV